MPDNTPDGAVPGDPSNPVRQPYITEPPEGARVSVSSDIRVKGAAHPFYWVRIVTPGKEDELSNHGKMGESGSFTLMVKDDPPKGRFCFEVILWKDKLVLGRTPTRCIEIV